jgi:hypothetical protein
MNYLAQVKKHATLMEVAYGNIVTPETGSKAFEVIRDSLGRMGFNPSGIPVGSTGGVVTVVSGEPNSVTTGLCAPAVESPATVTEAAQDGLLMAMINGGVVVSETPKVEGDVGSTSGMFTVEAGHLVKDPSPEPDKVGGWPAEAEIEIVGLAPNRRSLKAKLLDGRTVSLERTLTNWKAADKVKGKLVRAGAFPLYRMVA